MLCDYGSCHVCEMEPEKMGYQQCEDEVKRFTTLAYRSPEMVDLYSGQKITTKSDIWVRGGEVGVRGGEVGVRGGEVGVRGGEVE